MSNDDRPTCGDSNPDGSRCTDIGEWRVWTPHGYPAMRCDGHRMPLGRYGSEHMEARA